MNNKSTNDLIDLALLDEYTDGSPDDMKELIEAFYETADESFEEANKSLNQNDTPSWEEAIHKLKGAFGYIGASKLQDFCEEIEKNADETKRSDYLEKLQQDYTAICQLLKEKMNDYS